MLITALFSHTRTGFTNTPGPSGGFTNTPGPSGGFTNTTGPSGGFMKLKRGGSCVDSRLHH